MKVIIAGGGTGGHLYPGIAVAEKLKERGTDFMFLVSSRGVEKKVLDGLGWENYIEQDVSGFAGVSALKKLQALNKFVSAVRKAYGMVNKDDKILLTGGFAAAPAAAAGLLKGAEIYIHEQNSVAGLVNKLMADRAVKFFTSFPGTAGAPGKAILTGNPVRKELFMGNIKEEDGKNILVLGGSGGSRILNKTVASASKALSDKGYNLRHQTGYKMYDETLEEYKTKGFLQNNTILEPYIDNMKEAYKWADIVVSRAGAGVVYEVTYASRPALYVPFASAAGNHQYFNALSMKSKGYCDILEEKDLSAENLVHFINKMFAGISIYKEALKNVERLDSAELVIQNMITEIAG